VVDNTTIRYALNDCQLGHQHQNVHAHFYCEKCQSVVCLNQLIIPVFCLPEGYTYYDADVIIKGACDHCNQ
jgi:Fur family transcriptional regulator, ferric uptake regulator